MNRPLAYTIPSVVVLLFILLTIPVWRWLWGEWFGNDYYSHGILIVPVSLYLAVQRVRHDGGSLHTPARSKGLWGVLFAAAGMGLYVYFLLNKAYYLAAFAMIVLLGGTVWTLFGADLIRKLVFPIAYLGLMVPLPFIERSTLPLAMFTGVCSGEIVRFLGMDVNIVGNSVTLPNANLVIGAQCSGINSLISLTSLTALAAYIFHGPIWGRVLLVVFSVPLAMASNILRVTTLLFVARRYGGDAAFTYYHDYSGPIFFVLILLLMLPLARLLRFRHLRTEVV